MSSETIPFAQLGLDNLFLCYRKVLIEFLNKDMIRVVEREGFYDFQYFGRPISKVEVLGIVVRKYVRQKKVVLQIDDGTNMIECVKYFDPNFSIPLQGIELGNLVSAKGHVNFLKGEFQIYLHAVANIQDHNMEVIFWATCINLHKTEYSKSFHYSGPRVMTASNPNPMEHCNCTMPQDVKTALLYCYCGTVPCSADPNGQFRTIFLKHLLQLEDEMTLVTATSESNHKLLLNQRDTASNEISTKENCAIIGGSEVHSTTHFSNNNPLQLTFRYLRQDPFIRSICINYLRSTQYPATSEGVGVSNATTTHGNTSSLLGGGSSSEASAVKGDRVTYIPRLLVSQENENSEITALLRQVCQCLSREGIFWLHNVMEDSYMLMTVRRVLVPLVERYMQSLVLESAKMEINEDNEQVIEDLIIKRLRTDCKALVAVPRWRLVKCIQNLLLRSRKRKAK